MKYLYIFIICFLLGCGSPMWTTLGDVQLVQYNKEYTISQFDSLCDADTISSELKNWETVPLLDEESKTPIKRYLYIKDSSNLYILTVQDSIYNVSKRIVR